MTFLCEYCNEWDSPFHRQYRVIILFCNWYISLTYINTPALKNNKNHVYLPWWGSPGWCCAHILVEHCHPVVSFVKCIYTTCWTPTWTGTFVRDSVRLMIFNKHFQKNKKESSAMCWWLRLLYWVWQLLSAAPLFKGRGHHNRWPSWHSPKDLYLLLEYNGEIFHLLGRCVNH